MSKLAKARTRATGSDRLTVQRVASAIRSLRDRGGSRFKDIQNSLAAQFGEVPSFLELRAVLSKGIKEGVIKQNNNGRFLVHLNKLVGKLKSARASKSDSDRSRGGFSRRRRRRYRRRRRRRRRRRYRRRRGRRRRRGSRRRRYRKRRRSRKTGRMYYRYY